MIIRSEPNLPVMNYKENQQFDESKRKLNYSKLKEHQHHDQSERKLNCDKLKIT